MNVIYVPRVFGGTLALTAPLPSTLPTLLVAAHYRDGNTQAPYRDGETQALHRDGNAQVGER